MKLLCESDPTEVILFLYEHGREYKKESASGNGHHGVFDEKELQLQLTEYEHEVQAKGDRFYILSFSSLTVKILNYTCSANKTEQATKTGSTQTHTGYYGCLWEAAE
mgnify:CR=1 FL=1